MPVKGTKLARALPPTVLFDSDSEAVASSAAARLEALLEAAQDAIVVINEQAVILTFSPAAERMFGYQRHEILGRSVETLMPEPYRSEHQGYMSRYLDTGKPRVIGKGRQIEALRRDGTVFPAYLAIGDALIDDHHVFVGIVHDLTEQTQAEQGRMEERLERLEAEREAERLREGLAHAGRLGLVNGMAASIAHELAQPLAAILNYTGACRALQQQGALDDRHLNDLLGKIVTSAELAKDVVGHVRGFVKKRESLHRPTEVKKLVREAIALAEMQAQQPSVPIEADIAPDIPLVSVDSVQIHQVLLNLMRNAMEAMKDTDVEDRRVRVKVTHRESEVHFRIIDAGETIAPDMEDKVFRLFSTTKATGMGMGLSICRSILDGHGGRIWFSRNIDVGTTFHFTLPIAKP